MDEMKALSDVFNLRPEMFMQGMRSLENVRQSDQQRLQQQELANQQATLQNQFSSEINPIKADQARFGLMKDRAMFPGDLAQSQGQFRKEKDAGNLTPDQVPQALTHAASFAVNPAMHTPALSGVMRGILKNAYVPEIMDSWTGPQWAANLPKMLQSYTSLLPKNAAASALADQKDFTKLQIEEERTKRATTVANIAAAAKKNAVAKAPKDPKSLGEYATKLFTQADALAGPGASEEDMARATELNKLANEYQRRFEQFKISTSPVATPAIDPTQLKGADGTPRFPAKPIPQPTVDKRNAVPQGGPYTDAEKERRYQEWAAKQGKRRV
jgi:hypothetical protein